MANELMAEEDLDALGLGYKQTVDEFNGKFHSSEWRKSKYEQGFLAGKEKVDNMTDSD